MRTVSDRIRHAIGFEVIGLLIVVFGLSQFGFNIGHVGIVGVLFSIIATVWTYFYNQFFDNFIMRTYNVQKKKVHHRILQSIGFEVGLLIITIPVLSVVLKVTLMEAFILDIGLVAFYLFFSFFYNVIYDATFPIKQLVGHDKQSE